MAGQGEGCVSQVRSPWGQGPSVTSQRGHPRVGINSSALWCRWLRFGALVAVRHLWRVRRQRPQQRASVWAGAWPQAALRAEGTAPSAGSRTRRQRPRASAAEQSKARLCLGCSHCTTMVVGLATTLLWVLTIYVPVVFQVGELLPGTVPCSLGLQGQGCDARARPRQSAALWGAEGSLAGSEQPQRCPAGCPCRCQHCCRQCPWAAGGTALCPTGSRGSPQHRSSSSCVWGCRGKAQSQVPDPCGFSCRSFELFLRCSTSRKRRMSRNERGAGRGSER